MNLIFLKAIRSSSWTSLIPFGSTREKRSCDCVLLGGGSRSAG